MRGLILSTALISAIPLAAAPPSPAVSAAEQKSDLRALDQEIVRFDALLARVADREQKAVSRALLDGFKDRQAAVHQAFDHDRYLELRWEIDVEYQRLVAWQAGSAKAAPPKRG